MKILWVVNLMLPAIAQELSYPASNREGWLSGLFDSINSMGDEYELSIAFPMSEPFEGELKVNKASCYAFYENLATPERYDEGLEEWAGRILNTVKPDVLHIFGTEFPHAYAFAKVFNNPEKILVGMQGICSVIAKDYMAGIPESVRNKVTFRDFVKKDSLKEQQNKFTLRGENEQKLLGIVKNVAGRTDFDREFVKSINSDVKYFKLNETMRDVFYSGKWIFNPKNQRCIFMAQADYPIKGMHFLLEAAGILVKKYPDLKIKIAGNSIINRKTLKDKIKTPAYGAYLLSMINRYKLKNNIEVLGPLTKEQMKEQYLKCSVFVCPSYVENSPNTVAEAMLLGTPIVASNACGIPSVISEKEGFIFNRGMSEDLAKAIESVWEMEKSAHKELSEKCRASVQRAKEDYNGLVNTNVLKEIYDEIFRGI